MKLFKIIDTLFITQTGIISPSRTFILSNFSFEEEIPNFLLMLCTKLSQSNPHTSILSVFAALRTSTETCLFLIIPYEATDKRIFVMGPLIIPIIIFTILSSPVL